MSELFGRHRTLPDGAVAASEARGICTPFPEVPSGKINGETARDDAHGKALMTEYSAASDPIPLEPLFD